MNNFQPPPSVNAPAALHDKGHPEERLRMRLACAWCGQVIEDGPGPVSHGMCHDCRATFLAMIPEG